MPIAGWQEQVTSAYRHLSLPMHMAPSIGAFGGHALASVGPPSVGVGASLRASAGAPSVADPPLPAAASVEPPPDPPLPPLPPLPADPPEPPVDPPLPAEPPAFDPPEPPEPPVAAPLEPDIVIVLEPPLPPVAEEPLLPAEPVGCCPVLSSPPQCAAAITTSAIEGAIHRRVFMRPPG
jgi:hypothetical protein